MNRKGFTLIEAILTIAIISVGMIGVIAIFSGQGASSLKADQTVVASNLAKEKLEEIIADRASLGYTAVVTTRGDSYYSDGAQSPPFPGYTRTVTFLTVDPDDDDDADDFLDAWSGGGDSGYTRITVTVAWENQSVVYETLLTNYTP